MKPIRTSSIIPTRGSAQRGVEAGAPLIRNRTCRNILDDVVIARELGLNRLSYIEIEMTLLRLRSRLLITMAATAARPKTHSRQLLFFAELLFLAANLILLPIRLLAQLAVYFGFVTVYPSFVIKTFSPGWRSCFDRKLFWRPI